MMLKVKDRVKNTTGVIQQEGEILTVEGHKAKVQWNFGFVNWWRMADLKLIARSEASDQAAIEALL